MLWISMISCRKENDQDPCHPNYDRGLKSWYIPEVRQWKYIALWKQTASGATEMDEKGIFQINSSISGTRICVNLLKQWNHIWYSSCNWESPPGKVYDNLLSAPRSPFCTDQREQMNWDAVEITTHASLKCLMVALISPILPAM